MALLVTALEGDAVLLGPAGLEGGVVPVGIGTVVFVSFQQIFAQVADVGLIVNVLLRAEDVGLLAQGLQGEAAVVGDVGGAFLTTLGGDEHDTVTGLGAVDGGGGGVLQDLHGFDHRRIQVLDVVHLQTIDDEERSDVAGVRGITTDADVGTGTRSTGGVDDLDTGGLTLEGSGGVGDGTVLQVFGTDRSDGAGEVALALDTVTDHDRLLQEFSVFLEGDVEHGLVHRGESLIGITDAGDVDVGACRDVETESTVSVSHSTNGGVADNDDGGSDDGSSVRIDNRSADGAVLGGRNRSQEARCDDHHSGGHSCKKLPCHKSVVLVG